MSDDCTWMERLRRRIEKWAELWPHRMHRTAMVYRPELADAFVAFDRQGYEGAYHLFLETAERGDPAAQFNVGVLLESGWGTPRSDDAAERWYRKAAEQGLPDAQLQLATVLAADLVARDEVARDQGNRIIISPWQWFRVEASMQHLAQLWKQGDPITQRLLRREAQDDPDERRRYTEAYMWASLARRQQFSGAKTAVRRLKRHMGSDEVAAAQRLAKAWWVNKGMALANVRPGRRGGVAEGFRRVAIVAGILCALLGAFVGAVVVGGTVGWSILGIATVAGFVGLCYVVGWGAVRVVGWIAIGFLSGR